MNLFKDDFTALSGSDLYREVEAFLQLCEPVDNRPQESFQLDYKTEWGDSGLKTVTAFANTMGGLLFVGVEEQDLRPTTIPGVVSSSEQKTRIASSIAANISPTPSFDIGECSLPSEPRKRICLVRVRPSPALYLLGRGENPIYIRNGSESRPANAAQVRYLIERTRDPERALRESASRAQQLRSNLGITEKRETSGSDRTGDRDRQQSETELSIMLLPSKPLKATLDKSLEGVFRTLIFRRYPRIQQTLRGGVATEFEARGRDYFAYRWLHNNVDHEMVWCISSSGDIGFATQVRTPQRGHTGAATWSLGDVMAHLLHTLYLAAAYWNRSEYWGNAQLFANLNVQKLELLTTMPTLGGPETYQSPCVICGSGLSLDISAVSLAQAPATAAYACTELTAGTLSAEISDLGASLLNQLLRSMGHSGFLPSLKSSIDALLLALNA